MQLSQAIALGRTAIRPEAGRVFNSDRTAGCVLGMAGIAAGVKWDALILEHCAEETWPWLTRGVRDICECAHWQFTGTYLQAVAHLFDAHVMQDRAFWDAGREAEPWTLDELIDWVRSVEPAESPSSTEALAIEQSGRELVTEKI